jgi:D-arabinose 1-dehydrogenase-like Zn-dependent alcohol dehydrogenase
MSPKLGLKMMLISKSVSPPAPSLVTWDSKLILAHCGICSSDLHTLRSGWGPTNYPAVVGHEIVGKAVKVGQNVKGIKLGDRVGVGAQSGSCLECEHCEDSNFLLKRARQD